MPSTLELTLLFLLAAVAGVVVCRLLRLPPMLGYLAVGVLIGPHALGVAHDSSRRRLPGRIRYRLPDVRDRPGIQPAEVAQHEKAGLRVGLEPGRADGAGHRRCQCAALAWGLALTGRAWGLGWQSAVALGGALAMSSTAIVVKLMADRLELESEHGRRVMGVLLFQDLAVVPLAGHHPGARLLARGAAAGAGDRRRQGGRAARRAAGRRPARHALVADAGGAAQERGALHPQPAAGHARPGLADRAGRPLARARCLRRRHADRRDRIQAPGRDRHPAVPRRAARPLLHHRRHEARRTAVLHQCRWCWC